MEVRSAGTAPAERVNPVAVEAMREVRIDITAATPTGIDAVRPIRDEIRRRVEELIGERLPAAPGERASAV
jgi:arsenate reductase